MRSPRAPLAVLALAILPGASAALCVETFPLPDDTRLVFEYDAGPLAHFGQAGPRREPWIFDGSAIRPRDRTAPDGTPQPPPGGINTFWAAPETPDGSVFLFMQVPGERPGSSLLRLFTLDDATREFVELPFRGPQQLDVTDAIWSTLFGGFLMIGARDGLYDLSFGRGGHEIGALATRIEPGIRTLVDLPGLDAVLVVTRSRGEGAPADWPVDLSLFSEAGLSSLALPLTRKGWLRPREARPRNFRFISHPPALLYEEPGERGATGLRFTALEGQGAGIAPGSTAVFAEPLSQVAILDGTGFAFGTGELRDPTEEDLRIFDGEVLRPLTEAERGTLPQGVPLTPAFGSDQGIAGFVAGGRLYTYTHGRGFAETPLAPDAPPAGAQGRRVWYAPEAALSLVEDGGAFRVIGPGGGTETIRVEGLARVRIVPRYGEILILDDTRLRVASAGPCGP